MENTENNTSSVKFYSSVADHFYLFLAYLFLTVSLIIILVPLLFVISSSFSSVDAISTGKVFIFPVDFTLLGYKTLIEQKRVWVGFQNSVLYTVVGTAINIAMTMVCAYPLSRKDLTVRRPIMFMMSFTMIFSGGMIPSYLLVNSLGMIDTIWAMVIPGAMSVYNVILTRTFIETNIPLDLYESATLDGCRDFKFFLKIVIPLSRAIIAVMVLFYAVGHWNSYFGAMLYIKSPSKQILQIVLRDILIIDTGSVITEQDLSAQERIYIKTLLQYALIIVASAPMMVLYPFIQKHFIKGIMVGSLKG